MGLWSVIACIAACLHLANPILGNRGVLGGFAKWTGFDSVEGGVYR